MLRSEIARTNNRIARRRILREGGRLQQTLILDGGAVQSVASETVYGATQAEIEELVSGAATGLHYHTSARGRQNSYVFGFGGDVGQHISYAGGVDYALTIAVPYASCVVRMTIAVEQVSVGGDTVVQVYREGIAVTGCYLTLPEGIGEICVQFAMGLFNFAYCDTLTVGAIGMDADMVLARDGQAVLVLQAT